MKRTITLHIIQVLFIVLIVFIITGFSIKLTKTPTWFKTKTKAGTDWFVQSETIVV